MQHSNLAHSSDAHVDTKIETEGLYGELAQFVSEEIQRSPAANARRFKARRAKLVIRVDDSLKLFRVY